MVRITIGIPNPRSSFSDKYIEELQPYISMDPTTTQVLNRFLMSWFCRPFAIKDHTNVVERG